MTNIEALDIIFDFLPRNALEKLKKQGLYDPILSGQISQGAEIYDRLSEKEASFQDENYQWLANELQLLMNKGSLLQIGPGRGDLLMRLAEFNFKPIYGIDRSKVMLKKAAKRLKEYQETNLFQEKIENFNFSLLKNIDNVIINNFWGLLPEDKSKQLLNNLKKCIAEKCLIFIGPYSERPKDKEKLLAEKTLKENLGFVFSYPFFKDFPKYGYQTKLTDIGEVKYFILTKQNKHAHSSH